MSTGPLGAYAQMVPQPSTRAACPGATPAACGKPAQAVAAAPSMAARLPAAVAKACAPAAGAARVPPAVVDLSPEAIGALAQRTLETEVGEQLAAAFAEVGVDLSQALGQDGSVDATAQRIVDFSTGLWGVFRDQHADLGEDDAMALFEETLTGAVDEGYGQAIDILHGMSMPEDVLGQAQATIDRVHQLFDDFFARQRTPAESDAPSASPADRSPGSGRPQAGGASD